MADRIVPGGQLARGRALPPETRKTAPPPAVGVALDAPTTFAIIASLFVALMTAYMAYRVLRSYRATDDLRLLFVCIAFLVFSLKSVFIAITVVPPHLVGHDSIEAVGALFDAVIVVLLFVPFVVRVRP